MYAFQSTCPARGTTLYLYADARYQTISIHVPREGHDMLILCCLHPMTTFQSTCPARGTTMIKLAAFGQHCNFNPRAPRGARPGLYLERHQSRNFNPRAPRGARRVICPQSVRKNAISIHVPREGHDSKHAQFFRADLRKSYKYPAERDALPTKNVCKHIKTLG